MREYDDYDDYDDRSIRLYTPILQRVIILAAVVIAVPVLMWTITSFVRSYVARPRVPTLEHVASTNTARIPLIAASPNPAPSLAPSPAPAAPDQTAPPSGEGAAASDTAKPAAEIRRGARDLASLPDASPSPGAANGPSATSLQAAPAPPAIAAPAATAMSDTATATPAAASVASLPRSAQISSQVSSQASSQTPPQLPRSADNAPLSSGSSDRGIAWPNPNTTSPPDFGGPRLLSPAAPFPPPARTAAAEVVAPDEPLRGPVPLPRHRPNVVAMSTSGPVVSGPTASSPVPLPRARPGDAPAEAANSAIEQPAYGYRPGLDSDR